jgi:hypothetical protein
MPEHSDVPDWVPRTVARELVRIALPCDVFEAEERLIVHMRDLPPDEWRFRLWSAQITAAREGVRWFPSLSEEVAKTFKFRFWREVDAPREGARIHVGGNRAAYAGPLLVTAAEYRISPPPKGVIVPESLIVIDEWRQIEARVGDIRLRLAPLVAALRNAGCPVDMALDQLRAQGLLPAPGPARKLHWVEEALRKHRPGKDETSKHWTERATPKQARTAENWLVHHRDVWRRYGGK